MRKGIYRVVGGRIEQIIENNTLSVIDVAVDIKGNSVAYINIIPAQFAVHRVDE